MIVHVCHVYDFAGITGEVSIDANGDRNGDYSLLDMNKETGLFEVCNMCNIKIIVSYVRNDFYL